MKILPKWKSIVKKHDFQEKVMALVTSYDHKNKYLTFNKTMF